jgi:hypothetical protein
MLKPDVAPTPPKQPSPSSPETQRGRQEAAAKEAGEAGWLNTSSHI